MPGSLTKGFAFRYNKNDENRSVLKEEIMSRISTIVFLLTGTLLLFSCKTVSGISGETDDSVPVEINGDVFVEKNNAQPLLFSPDMKEYRLYGSLAAVIAENYNYNIVKLKGIPGQTRDDDGRIPFEVREILKGEKQ